VLYQLSYLGASARLLFNHMTPRAGSDARQSSPVNAWAVAGSTGASPVIWRRRLMRSRIGGWV